jgi:3-oxoacyl-[acyl-carrier protein] reductase
MIRWLHKGKGSFRRGIIMDAQKPIDRQVALVTGASRGIGLAIARRLGLLGARLTLCSRNPNELRAAADGLRGEGMETLAVVADVTRADQVTALVEQTNATFGDIDILVNNAGIGIFRPAHELSEEEWDRVMGTNLKGVFLCSRAVAPQMIRRRAGHIINVSSLAGKYTFAGGGAYCASKWGVLALTACAGEDLRGYGIRVSAVCPGSVDTGFSPHAGPRAVKDHKKMLQPDDVAHAVAMLVTQAPQSYISEVLVRPTQKP